MSATLKYAGAGIAILGIALGLLWPWLDPRARTGVVVAAVVAWPVQVGTFWALVRFRETFGRFLAVWAGGTLLRMGLIVGMAGIAWVGGLPALPTLLALAGFFFGLLLLEPLFFEEGDLSFVDDNGIGRRRDAW